MASNSDNFQLILPEKGEFTNAWDKPMNNNFTIIDRELGDVKGEVTDARGSAGTLAERLDEALNADGSVKPVPEIVKASSSQVYGRDLLGVDYDLDQRILQNDFESFYARQGETTLRDMLARSGNNWVHNTVVTAPSGFLSFTGANVKIDGSVSPVYANVNGYLSRFRTLVSIATPGAAGTKYFAIQREASGKVVLDSSLPSATFGTTLQEPATTGPLIKFKDASRNFATEDIQPGDLLIISTPGDNQGTYVIQDTFNTNGSLATSELLIKGKFQSLTSNLSYTIVDPFAGTLLIEDTDPGAAFSVVTDKIYIGQGAYNGVTYTSFTTYQQLGKFQEWQAVTLSSGNFEAIYNHNIGFVPRSLQIFASASSDFASPLIPLGIASGPSGLERNVIVQITREQIKIKNPVTGIFYKDYDGVTQTSGFLLVLAER